MKKQILKFISFCFLNSIFSFYSNAQVVYTDMADTTIIRSALGASLYGIDLNNDGTTDIQFRVGKFKACAFNMQANCSVSINASVDSNEYVADIVGVQKLVINNILNSNNAWDNQFLNLRNKSVNLSNCQVSYSGHWTTTSDGYVGIKFFDNNQIYYGWARISVQLTTSTAILIVKDYAYNSIPGQPILAGETSCTTPTVNLTQSGSLSFCAGDSVTLTANGTGYQYQWKKGGVNISGATSQTYVAKTVGTYKCKVTNSCGTKTSGGKTVTVPCKIDVSTSDISPVANSKIPKGISALSYKQKNNSDENETGSLRQISNSIDNTILDAMNIHHIPGLSAAIIKNGKIAWTKGYGYADVEKNIPFTPNTINAEIGSISKTVTATAIMKLWEQGLFGLDDAINNYLPFAVSNPYFPNNPITFRMLLDHTSSISDPGIYYYNFDFNNSPTESLGNYIYDILNPAGTLYEDSIYYNNYLPGSQFVYSDYGYVVLGFLAEQISGMPFEQYCNQNIFQPLCMNHTSWHFSGVDTNIVSRPYYYDDALGDYVDYGLYEYPDYPDAQIKTSAIDLSKYLLMLINYGTLDGIKILDSSTVALMRTVQSIADSSYGLSYGLGLYYNPDYGGYPYWGHRGQDYGITTEMWIKMNDSTGIITLINSEDDALTGCGSDDIFCLLSHIADTISASSQPDLNCSYAFNPCEHSRTYWKNNSNQWALNSVPMKLGTKHFYNEHQLLTLLNRPVNGNASIVLAKQLIAAKLNAAQGSELSPIISTINDANNLIVNRHLPVQPGISFNSSQGIQMLAMAATLDLYNHRFLNTGNCSGNGNREVSEVDETDYDMISNNGPNIFPNPFSQSTKISFTIEQSENISLKIFDVNGRLIKILADNFFEAGEHEIEFNAEKINAGIYFLKIETNTYSENKKLIVTK